MPKWVLSNVNVPVEAADLEKLEQRVEDAMARVVCGDMSNRVTVRGELEMGGSSMDVSGDWAILGMEQRMDEVDVTTFGGMRQLMQGMAQIEMHLVKLGPIDEDREARLAEKNRQHALREAPEDVREALKALFELDAQLPDDKEAIVQVRQVEGKPRFDVAVQDRQVSADPDPEPCPAHMVPVCPVCKGKLGWRGHHRRFTEDDRYVECVNGHVWKLKRSW